MIEQGIVMLVQANAAVLSALAQPDRVGGFFAELPKDQALPSWSYRIVSNVSGYTLAGGKPGFSMNRLQIDCYGATAPDVIGLAKAIDHVLSGYGGTLSDPDVTKVNGIFQSDVMDFFDDARRSFRRMLEYEVYFFQN